MLTITPLALLYEQYGLAQTSPAPKQPPIPKEPPPPVPCEASFPRWFCAKAPIATVGNNVYIAWNSNDTGHWNVFFVKSDDGGKTFGKNIMLSAPNKGHVVDQNVQIAASGSNLYVTWWTNKIGVLMPVFRASNDVGNTFGKIMVLNSTNNSRNTAFSSFGCSCLNSKKHFSKRNKNIKYSRPKNNKKNAVVTVIGVVGML